MESTVVAIVKSIVSYIDQRCPMLTPPQVTQLLAAQCQACITHLRATSVSHAEAGCILGVLSDEQCLFDKDQISKISAVVDEKVAVSLTTSSMAASGSGSMYKTNQQTHDYLRHYLTEYIWTVVNSHMPMSAKLEQCAAFMVQSLLLRNPSEKTRRDMIAIILAATGEECGYSGLGCSR